MVDRAGKSLFPYKVRHARFEISAAGVCSKKEAHEVVGLGNENPHPVTIADLGGGDNKQRGRGGGPLPPVESLAPRRRAPLEQFSTIPSGLAPTLRLRFVAI